MPQRSDDYNYIAKFVPSEAQRTRRMLSIAIVLAIIIVLLIVASAYALPMPQRHG